MKTTTTLENNNRPVRIMVRLIGLTAAVAMLGGGLASASERGKKHKHCRTCEVVAELARKASYHEALDDFYLGIASALTISDRGDRREAAFEVWSEYREARSLTRDQYEARLELCKRLGECRYDPEIDPDFFCSPEEIAANPNPYFPLVPGTTFLYEGETDEGTETIEVHISEDTREIMGVTCIVVEDTVWLDGELIEDTRDWHAQDKDGNVWYFGELSLEYEDDEIVGLEGSWEAGEDGAKPGIVMFANPVVGVTYRQEFLLGEAEDVGEVLALDATADVPYGFFVNCLQTADYTPLEPDALEHKFYAPGVGFVREVKPDTGEMVELISIQTE